MHTKNVVFFLFFSIIFNQSALATWETSSILGNWNGSGNFSKLNVTNFLNCENVKISLQKINSHLLHLQINYDCISSYDWHFSKNLTFNLDENGDFIGEDGYLKVNEFYWNGAQAYKGGPKVHLKLDQNNMSAENEDLEGPYSYSKNIIIRAQLHKDTTLWKELNLPLFLNTGPWSGAVHLIEKDLSGTVISQIDCEISHWEILNTPGILAQTHFYLPQCVASKDVNFYIGPYFFEYGKIFQYDRNSSMRLIEVGNYTNTGFVVESSSDGDFLGVKYKGYTKLSYQMLAPDHLEIISETKFLDATVFPLVNRWLTKTIDIHK